MKERICWFRVLALVTGIGLFMIACDNGTGAGGDSSTQGGGSESGPDLTGVMSINTDDGGLAWGVYSNVYTGMQLTVYYYGSEVITAYQWKKDGTKVGANSNRYTPTAAGDYTVTLSAAGYKSMTSGVVTVKQTLNLSGTVTVSPNSWITIGNKLTANYTGGESVNFQWKKDGTNTGTGSSSIFTPMEAGQYTVTVSAVGFNSKTSATVKVMNYTVTTVAGGAFGYADGQGTAAKFNSPNGITVDSAGNIYVADYGNNCIRKIDNTGYVSTLAGSSGSRGSADGQGATAQFYNPAGIAVDSVGNIYVADSEGGCIRKIDSAGYVTTVAGGGPGIYADGQGTAAKFYEPGDVAVDSAGNIYVADTGNHCIRKIDNTGYVTTFAGTTGVGLVDGQGTAARFIFPQGIAMDFAGNIYVAEGSGGNNNCIRKISSTGYVTTLAGSTASGFINGQGTAAQFNNPAGVTVDSVGNIYVADPGNNCIRKIDSTGYVSTLVGSTTPGFADGQGTAAQFNGPYYIAVDSAGNIYVTDYNNNCIRKIVIN